MAQEYRLTHVQIDKEPFVDQHGNTWLTVAFEGVSEPVKWVVKDPSRLVVGDSYFGEVNEATSKAGKPYRRFKKITPEETPSRSYSGSTANYTPKKEWQPRDDSAIQAQWAIGQAVQLIGSKVIANKDGADLEPIEACAKHFFAMIDRVKHSQEVTQNEDNEAAEMRSLMDSLPSEDELDNLPY